MIYAYRTDAAQTRLGGRITDLHVHHARGINCVDSHIGAGVVANIDRHGDGLPVGSAGGGDGG